MLSICIEYLPLAKCVPIVLHTTRVSEHVVSRYEHGSSLMKICEYLAEEMCQRSSDLVHYKPQNSAYIYQSPDVYYLPSHLAIILAIIISIIISSFSSSALSLLCNWRGWSPETWFNLGQAEKQFLGLNFETFAFRVSTYLWWQDSPIKGFQGLEILRNPHCIVLCDNLIYHFISIIY